MPRRVEQAPLTPAQAQGVMAGWIGLSFLALALVMWYATGVRNWYTNLVLGVSILALVDWAIFASPLVIGRFSRRQLVQEANATVFILCAVGIVIFLNIVAYRRMGALEWDLTKNKRYSLSSFSKSVVKKVPEKVEVTAFIPKPAGTFAAQFGQMRQQTQDLMRQYEAANPKVNWRLVDPYVDRALATQKNIKSYPTLLFETAGKREEATNITEKDLTGAFLKLQSGQKKKIYFLQGHGELDPDDFQPEASIGSVKQLLVDLQHETEKLTLMGKKAIPADAAVLVIAGPKYPLRAEETKAVQEYLKGGGHVLLLVGPSPKSPALNDLLQPWGVKVGNDMVLALSESVGSAAIPALAAYETHDVTRDLRGVLTAYPFARSVTPITPAPAGVTVTPLMKTSANSWAETNLKASPKLDASDTPGPVTLGVAVTKDLSGPAPAGDKAGGKTGKIARLVVIGSAEMASNRFTQSLPGNADLLGVAINWLAEEEALVNIPPKEETPQNITLTDPQRRVISTTVYALPLAAMLLGMAVWWKRR
jgi:ABC-type uncharacterized transport system involved in gliding motility auxiliary subunit